MEKWMKYCAQNGINSCDWNINCKNVWGNRESPQLLCIQAYRNPRCCLEQASMLSSSIWCGVHFSLSVSIDVWDFLVKPCSSEMTKSRTMSYRNHSRADHPVVNSQQKRSPKARPSMNLLFFYICSLCSAAGFRAQQHNQHLHPLDVNWEGYNI